MGVRTPGTVPPVQSPVYQAENGFGYQLSSRFACEGACDCFVTKHVISYKHTLAKYFQEAVKMDKNKGKVKLNDELLDKVSGGEYNPFDQDGDGYMDITVPFRCTNCTVTCAGDLYSAGQECPSCHIGYLF